MRLIVDKMIHTCWNITFPMRSVINGCIEWCKFYVQKWQLEIEILEVIFITKSVSTEVFDSSAVWRHTQDRTRIFRSRKSLRFKWNWVYVVVVNAK